MVKNGQLDSTLRFMHHGQANKNYYFLPNVVFTYYIGEKVIVFLCQIQLINLAQNGSIYERKRLARV